jgi:very-short-patch-repair endonuclease
VRSIRRGWVALPDADPVTVGAATRGVVITCVSAAERIGLWVPEASPLHVAARPNAARVRVPSQVVIHWARPVVPRDPETTVDEIVNTLSLVAQCQPREIALVIWESALNKRLIDKRLLSGFELPHPARELLELATPFSDSGLETIFVTRLRWLDVPMVPQAWLHGHRIDLLIGERLVIQIDGATHVGAQRTTDIEHDAQLMLRGYTVLRFGYEQIMARWPEVQAIIMDAVAQGKHLG